MKILFAASECVPFYKSGGLADVIGSLPTALRNLGVEVRVVLPKYSSLPEHFIGKLKLKDKFVVKLGWRNQYCGLEEFEHEGIHYYFIDNEFYFKRDSLYGYLDEAERFIYFSRAVLASLPFMEFRPDIIHLHDWQTAIISLLLKVHYGKEFFYQGIKTVLTIHNLRYQGIFQKDYLNDLLDLGWEYYDSDRLEFHGDLNLLKGGIVYCDALTTVSPSYAKEIQYPFYGEKLDGLLRSTNHKLRGIINGIDYREWDPDSDPYIYENYSVVSLEKKALNKQRLQEALGLKVDSKTLLIAIISRLVDQKGLDLIECVFEEILKRDIQLVVLGTGDSQYEELFRVKAKQSPEKVSANIRFDNALAHKIYAGADLLLMPSLFEPCGLSQLIALRYGTLPLVRETGGLRDTVLSYNDFTGEGYGFSFFNYNAHDMLFTLDRAINCYKDQDIWVRLQKNAMEIDNGWRTSAQDYYTLYQELMI